MFHGLPQDSTPLPVSAPPCSIKIRRLVKFDSSWLQEFTMPVFTSRPVLTLSKSCHFVGAFLAARRLAGVAAIAV
jgi:hypothetical protein